MATPSILGQAVLGDFLLGIAVASEDKADSQNLAINVTEAEAVTDQTAKVESQDLAINVSETEIVASSSADSQNLAINITEAELVIDVTAQTDTDNLAINVTEDESAIEQAAGGDWIELVSPLIYPYDLCGATDSISGLSALIDAAGEGWGICITAPKAGTIAKIHSQIAALTTPAEISIRLETVNPTTGQPSGTLIAAGAEGFFTPGAIGKFSVTMGTPPTVTKGQVFWVVFGFSGTTGNLSFTATSGATPLKSASNVNGYAMTRSSAGVWSAQTNYCNLGVEYGDGSMPYLGGFAMPIESLLVVQTISAFYGNKITFPFKCKVFGAMVAYEATTISWAPKLQVYNSSDTLLYDYVLPQMVAINVANAQGMITSFFPGSPIEVNPGDFLRIGLNDNPAAGGDVGGGVYRIYNSAAREQFGAKDAYLTSKTGASFTDTTDRLFSVAAMVSHLWDPLL